MTSLLYRVARWCAAHAVLVVVAWLLLAAALAGVNRLLPVGPPGMFVLNGTDSADAQVLLAQAFPGSGADSTPLLIHAPITDLSTPEGSAVVQRAVTELESLPEVTSVTGPADDVELLSTDHHTVMLSVILTEAGSSSVEFGEEMISATEQAVGAGIEVALGGILGQKVSTPETHSSEVLGLIAALLVLFVSLRRVTATLIPLVSAMVAVAIGLFIIDLLGRVVFIPDVAPTLGTMLGLGVGIDYALFLITKHRTLLREGYPVADSVGRTAGTAGAGMVFAGSTLIAALCGLALTGLSFLAWLGFASAIVVAVAVVSSITFVPALLGLSRRSVVPRNAKTLTAREMDEELDSSFWARIAGVVTGHPWWFAIGAALLLALLAAPAATLQLGHTDAGIYPQGTTAREAYDLTTQAFGPGATAPLAVVASLYEPATSPQSEDEDGANGRGGGNAEADAGNAESDGGSDSGAGDPRRQDPRLLGLQSALLSTPGVVSADAPIVSTDGGVVVVRVIPEWSGADSRTGELVTDLRERVLPQAAAGKGMDPHVGGVTAATTDLSELIAAKTPWFILGVVLLAFVLLMMAYRSLLIPFKAAVMNLISIAAAYGVVVMVFQWGWGVELIGLEGPVAIESYVPLMMFAVLFGLSMDYEVFLLTAFREHWERSGDMLQSVRRGLAETGRVVTSAALIMCVVFGSFVLSDNAIVKMFGVGLASAVFIDATVVRCMLVPAIMVLAQRGTWWLPAWLDRLLPQLQVEGDPKALEQETRIAAAGGRPRPQNLSRVLMAMLGVALAWVISLVFAADSGFTVLPTAGTMLPAAAVSAAAAGLAVAVPLAARRGAGARGAQVGELSPGLRSLSFAIGAVVLLLLAQAVGGLGDPGRTSGWLAGWAIVLLGLALVAMSRVPVVLPAALGALAMAITLATEGAGDAATALMTCLGPAVVVWLVALIGRLVFRSRKGQRAEVRDDGAKQRAAVGPELADGMQAQAGANATEGRQAR
ncbi:MAG: MMPL family transporter [Actinobacteria bacterium]|nr:MAG: MMPL family transporter [Actinomycetota bacterium]